MSQIPEDFSVFFKLKHYFAGSIMLKSHSTHCSDFTPIQVYMYMHMYMHIYVHTHRHGHNTKSLKKLLKLIKI